MNNIDISYKNYSKKSDIHGTVLYPAVMVAPMQKKILGELISTTEVKSVFDPFHGSGTALYETMEIDNSIYLIGCDINPLANLITKVKLQGISKDIDKSIESLVSNLKDDEYDSLYTFKNMEKWFKNDIAEELKKIRSAIIKVKNKKDRLYFWYILCDIIRKYSNTRSSTYKLHKKEEKRINNIENTVIKDFISNINKYKKAFYHSTDRFTLYKNDINEIIDGFSDREFDISITSPPYGENATTVPYGQFSILALLWIDKKDLELEGWELDTYSKIDYKSLGGINKTIKLTEFENGLIEPYIKNICDRKKKKVLNFFNDYFYFLKRLCKVTDKYIVMTLGNRRVDKVKINLTDITNKFLENNMFKTINIMEREIPIKRIPKVTSKVGDSSVESMNYEYIIISKRKK